MGDTRNGKTRQQMGKLRPGAVIKQAKANFFGAGRVASLEETLEVYTALMRGRFDYWDCFDNLQDHSKLNAILDAATLLGKHHGAFQKPSENERDREWRLMQYISAAYGIRDQKMEQGQPFDPETIWNDMVEWAKLRETEKELLPLQNDIIGALTRDAERKGYIH